ncbi:MAG: alanine racemase [Pseudomonadota bacterium]
MTDSTITTKPNTEDAYRPILTVDRNAICHNFKMLSPEKDGARGAAVLKADAYGSGAAPVAEALTQRANCRLFYVVHPHEGAEIRKATQSHSPDAVICVLGGPTPEALSTLQASRLTPVLNTLQQCQFWREAGAGAPAALHLDTGMRRLGLPLSDCSTVAAIDDFNIDTVISHLVSSDAPEETINERQYTAFKEAASLFPNAKQSLSATGGALLGPQFGLDFTRPGIGLYGVDPAARARGDLKTAGTLSAEVLQVQSVAAGERVGYDGVFEATRHTNVATIAMGYADGYPRAISTEATAYLGGALCPIIGRISMDLITIDVTDAPEPVRPGDRAELFGPRIDLLTLSAWAGTIPNEVLTRLGGRVVRHYAN